MRQANGSTVRSFLAQALPLLSLLALAGCVGVPSLDSFKYATQAEREDAQVNDDIAATDDIATEDLLGNDTLTGDGSGKTDASDAQDSGTDADVADVGTDGSDVADAGTDAADGSDADIGPDVPPPECVTSTNCAGKWTATELGPCFGAECVKGVCSKVAKTTACDDADACTLGDLCVSGKCTGTSVLSCTDGDACSADKCDPKTGCYFIAGAGCDDGNVCTADTCDFSNACVHLAADATCSDGNACTTGDTCSDSVCVALDVTVCNDENACTDDSCDPATGCVFLANSATCDDGDICTVGDACGGSGCVAGAKDTCSDGNPCTDDACDSGAGCLHVNNYVGCDDGNKCTPGDTCQGGNCVGLAVSATAFCNDGNACTDDACDPLTGCGHAHNAAACDDGLPCTVGDVCSGGKCTAGTSACECKKDADCAVKEDGNPCNGTLVCDLSAAPYKCVVSAKTIVVCDASGDSTCAKNTCNKTTGGCSYVAQQEGGACDADGSVCTENDACKSGTCTPGAAIDCDDGQPCTTDSCDKINSCQHFNNANACNDGNACTIGDVCGGGACVPGTKTVCDDGNACTADSCNASTGNCNYAIQFATTCSDGNACSQNDACDAAGQCVGAAVTCNDGAVCTSDSCNPASGCVYTPNTIACNDSNACTNNDACSGGTCVGTAVTVATFCDDGNPCTVDTCDPSAGCKHAGNTNAPCDDGNTCTSGDYCVGTVCTSGTNSCTCNANADCATQEDNNLCNGTLFCDLQTFPYNCKVDPATVVVCSGIGDTTCAKNTCVPASGACTPQAQNNGATCNADNSVCTPGDKCSAGMCNAGGTLDCNDANPCTTDACDPVNGCTHTANANACSDGNACTTNDVCSNTQCTAGTAVVCNDNNVCTSDACNPASGACSYVNNSASCDDGSLCTTNDKCGGGACGGMAINCSDSNVCTDDGCVAATGCTNVANSANCSDSNPCTVGDTCANKTCQPGNTKNCNDNNACTTDSCNVQDGTCVNTANTLGCNDANACTSGDVCSNKICGGTAITCTDNNLCTTDTCAPAKGCDYAPSVNCDDGNVCSLDACVPATGACTHSLLAGLSCEDGDPCTTQDYCTYFTDAANGTTDTTKFVCAAGAGAVCDDGNACTSDTCSYAATHTCAHAAMPSGTSCGTCSVNNSVNWFAPGMCSGTTCTLGSATTCDDSNQCTDDVCYNGAGCTHMSMAGKECNDGTDCTIKDLCSAQNTCVGLNACDDNNACTTDFCSVVGAKVMCVNNAMPKGAACDDGNACTTGDTCDASQSCNATDVKCDDGLQCTADTCDVTTGCVFTNMGGSFCSGSQDCQPGASCLNSHCWVACDDGNPCTSSDNCGGGTCNASGIVGAINCTKSSDCGGSGAVCSNGYCANTCNDGNVCTVSDYCFSGACVGSANSCNDSNPCTTDSCSAASGCAHAPAADDGNPCTNDFCAAGVGTITHSNVGDGLQCGATNYCKAGTCTACGAGTVATPYDDNGTAQLVCAFDYPIWGIRPLSPASFTSNGDNTVTDNVTGLMWMLGTYSINTFGYATTICDTQATYGNKYDWRLPTVAELQTINDYVLQNGYSLGSAFFGQGFRLWAQPAIATNNAFDLNTVGGAIEYLSNTNSFNLKCVRGQSAITPPGTRYTVSSDQTSVYDNATNILWLRATTSSDLPTAAATCTSNGAGWRLPNVRELESIVDRSNAPVSYFNTTGFGTQTAGVYWSTTPLSTGSGANPPFWFVNFTDGTSGTAANNTANRARCMTNCDDGNPCTTDGFDKSTWLCKHTNAVDGVACGGAGICASGACNCPTGAYGVSIDDNSAVKFQCVFDYPVWGVTSLAPPNQSNNSDGTVSDGKTSLMWQDGKGSAATLNWSQARNYCDNLILAGKADWRLPSVAELESIVDYTTASAGPNISSAFNSGTVTTGYWTGRGNAQASSNAWEVVFAQGLTSYSPASTTYINARCVRGGPMSGGSGTRFINLGGTPTAIKDNITGLTWEQSAHAGGGTYIQSLAATACVSPYRTPNIRELASIVDRGLVSTPALNAVFSGGSGTFWSATLMSAYGLSVNFTTGGYGFGGNASTYFVRCVK